MTPHERAIDQVIRLRAGESLATQRVVSLYRVSRATAKRDLLSLSRLDGAAPRTPQTGKGRVRQRVCIWRAIPANPPRWLGGSS